MIDKPITNRLNPDELSARLESMKAEMYWPEFNPPKNITDLLNTVSSLEYLRRLGSTDLAEYSVMLGAYALFLNTQENRLTAYINWCESNLRFLVGQKAHDVEGYFTEKDLYIRANDPDCKKLENIKLECQVKFDAIKDIHKRLEFFIGTLKNLYFERRNNHATKD